MMNELAVIWLHGLGQGPQDVQAVAERLALDEAGVRGVFPHAPAQSVSAVTGRPASAWFRQTVDTPHMRVDSSSLQAGEQWLHALIDAEVGRFGARRVALAGFSQGATMALYSGLRYPRPLGGIATYAAFSLDGLKFPDPPGDAAQRVPLWMGYGTRDFVVPFSEGRRLARQLAGGKHQVSFHWYRCGHETFGGVSTELADFFASLRTH